MLIYVLGINYICRVTFIHVCAYSLKSKSLIFTANLFLILIYVFGINYTRYSCKEFAMREPTVCVAKA